MTHAAAAAVADCQPSGAAILDREEDAEFTVIVNCRVEFDASAELVDDDVVAHREAESSPLARRLGSEEGLEDPPSEFLADADSVVTDADLGFTPVPRGCHAEARLVAWLAPARALGERVEGVDDEVEYDTRELLVGELDTRKRGVIGLLE